MAITYQYANADQSQVMRTDDTVVGPDGTGFLLWHPSADHPIARPYFDLWTAEGSPKPADYVESETLTKLLQDAGVR